MMSAVISYEPRWVPGAIIDAKPLNATPHLRTVEAELSWKPA
jgi:hypothetical protein